MPRERFRNTGDASFFGALVYDRVVPQGHFLRQLRDLLDWEALTQEWVSLYKGGAEYGPPPYHPALVLKMLFLAYLYNLSERQVEEYVNDSLSAKYFLGLGADALAPDSTTLTVFKGRLLKAKGTHPLEMLLHKVVAQAQEKGIAFGRIQVVDSVHTVAQVDQEQEDRRRRQGEGPRDPGARWGTKGARRVRGPDGKGEKRPKHFFGYKAHVSLNAENGLITSLVVTSGEVYDGHYLRPLVVQDVAQGLPVEVYAGDRGYDDGENHEFLWQRGLKSALKLKGTRTQKRDPNKEPWLKLLAEPSYQAGLKERYKVERKFGEAKLFHGLGRCRYLGLDRYRIQGYLTALTLNFKRVVKLLTGVGFRDSSPWSRSRVIAA